MAISASTVTTTDTLENFRVEFNNLVADVESLQQVGASNIVIADGGNIGSASDQDAISIAANGVVTFSQAPSFTTGLLVSDLDIDGATLKVLKVDSITVSKRVITTASIAIDTNSSVIKKTF